MKETLLSSELELHSHYHCMVLAKDLASMGLSTLIYKTGIMFLCIFHDCCEN